MLLFQRCDVLVAQQAFERRWPPGVLVQRMGLIEERVTGGVARRDAAVLRQIVPVVGCLEGHREEGRRRRRLGHNGGRRRKCLFEFGRRQPPLSLSILSIKGPLVRGRAIGAPSGGRPPHIACGPVPCVRACVPCSHIHGIIQYIYPDCRGSAPQGPRNARGGCVHVRATSGAALENLLIQGSTPVSAVPGLSTCHAVSTRGGSRSRTA